MAGPPVYRIILLKPNPILYNRNLLMCRKNSRAPVSTDSVSGVSVIRGPKKIEKLEK
jgi:hypothetical protein